MRPSWLSAHRLAVIVLALASQGCDEKPLVGPLVAPDPPDNPQIVSASWIADIDLGAGTVRVEAPLNGYDPQVLRDFFGVAPASPDLSILAGDVVDIIVDPESLWTSAVGIFEPGLMRVAFDVAIRNKIGVIDLTRPTFPTPPSGTSGAILIPIETVVTTTPGGVQSDGTTVVVELPNQGRVAPSVDWDGEPHSFFNDVGCPADSNDCFRFEPFGDVLGGATSEFRTIGFDAEPTVSQFRARILVGADLADFDGQLFGRWLDSSGQPTRTVEPGERVTLQLCTDVPLTVIQFSLRFSDLRWEATNQIDLSPSQPLHPSCPALEQTIDLFASIETVGGQSLSVVWTSPSQGGARIASVSFRALQPGAPEVLVDQVREANGFDGQPLRLARSIEPLNVVVSPVGNASPVAETGGPYAVTLGSPLTFDGSGSVDSDGSVTQYRWGFGDGRTAEGVRPTHAYTSTGLFDIGLEVQDDIGAIGRDSSFVVVSPVRTENVIGRWLDMAGVPISSAQVGDSVLLQFCTTEDGLDAFQLEVQFERLIEIVDGDDLNSRATNPELHPDCFGARDGLNAYHAWGSYERELEWFLNFQVVRGALPSRGTTGVGSFVVRLLAPGTLSFRPEFVILYENYARLPAVFDLQGLAITP